jgi:hypothetical protein
MSYKPEVQTDNSGKWYDNALRFETEAEALASARDLERRWFAVRAVRASYSDDPVNYKLDLATYVMEAIAA